MRAIYAPILGTCLHQRVSSPTRGQSRGFAPPPRIPAVSYTAPYEDITLQGGGGIGNQTIELIAGEARHSMAASLPSNRFGLERSVSATPDRSDVSRFFLVFFAPNLERFYGASPPPPADVFEICRQAGAAFPAFKTIAPMPSDRGSSSTIMLASATAAGPPSHRPNKLLNCEQQNDQSPEQINFTSYLLLVV